MIEEKLKIWHQKASLLIFFDTFPNKISYLNSFKFIYFPQFSGTKQKKPNFRIKKIFKRGGEGISPKLYTPEILNNFYLEESFIWFTTDNSISICSKL